MSRQRGARWTTIGSAALLLMAALVAAGTSRAAAAPSAPSAPELGPMESGKAAYVAGSYVWTDYAYDDRGASAPPSALPNPLSSSPGGAATYPSGVPENSADLVQLQLTPTAAGLQVRAVLETLTNPAQPQLVVGFDTDRDAATGAAAPPGAWHPKTPLGLDHAVVIDSSGARLLNAAAGNWVTAASFGSTVDPAANTMTATIPAAALPVPASGQWNVVGALGLAGMATGASQPYDLAFVGGESPTPSTAWLSQRQGDILAGSAAPDGAVAKVDLGLLAQRATQLPDPRTPGYHFFLYHSALNLPEGIKRQTTVVGNNDQYLGPYQPYMVRVPDQASLPARAPMLLDLHGAGGSYIFDAQYVDGADNPVTGLLMVPSMQANALIVSPHARGGGLFYEGIGEKDVLDVYKDVQRHYSVDTSRVVLEGGSMGGMGTFRLASLYPDKFIGAVTIVGAQPYDFDTYWIGSVGAPVGVSRSKQVPSVPGLSDNLRNVPIRMESGTVDPLVAPTATLATKQGLEQRGYDYQFFLMPERSHSFVLPVENCLWNQFFATRTLDPSPAHVTYRVYPSQFMTDATTGLNLRYSGAYWVSGMQVRSGSDSGAADLTSEAVAQRGITSTTNYSVENNLLSGRDFCGPNPTARTGDTWVNSGRTNTLSQQPTANKLTGDLGGLQAATIDTAGAKLDPSTPMGLTLTGDGPTTVTLSGLTDGRTYTVFADGNQIANVTVENGRLVLPSRTLNTTPTTLTVIPSTS